MEKIVSQLCADGYFIGPVVADESPMEPGVFLLPGGCVDRKPPAVVEPGKRYRTWGAGWRGEDLPAPEPEPTPDQVEVRRAEILGRLSAIDGETARPAREIALAFVAGKPAPAFAGNKLAAMEAEAAALRAELAGL